MGSEELEIVNADTYFKCFNSKSQEWIVCGWQFTFSVFVCVFIVEKEQNQSMFTC